MIQVPYLTCTDVVRTMHTMSRDYSTFEAAAELGVNRSTVSRWIARGLLKATRFHAKSPARIPASEITRLQRAQSGTSNHAKPDRRRRSAA